MARTELVVTDLVPNSSIVRPTGVAGTVDGHYINTNVRAAINDDVKPEHLLLDITIANATTDVTLKAGDYPPALAAVAGDLTRSLAVGSHVVGPFESGRFLRRDGRVWLDYATPANVVVRAYRVPRNV